MLGRAVVILVIVVFAFWLLGRLMRDRTGR